MRYLYTAYTDSNDGVTFEYEGTLAGAIRAATRYARKSFVWDYEGYGPRVVVADPETKERYYEKRL